MVVMRLATRVAKSFLLITVFLVAVGARIATRQQYLPLLGKEGLFQGFSNSPSRTEGGPRMDSEGSAVDSSTNGRLDIFVAREPDPRAFPRILLGSDHYCNAFLTGGEWKALFFDVLACPEPLQESGRSSDWLEL